MNQVMKETDFNPDMHEYYMRKALVLARQAMEEDEVPVGCIIVHNAKLIAKAFNQVEKLRDNTAHAEMIALTQAESFLESKWLKGSFLYVTIEPCFMCAYAMLLCRVSRVYFGAYEPRTGALGSIIDVNNLKLNHRIEVTPGILEDECGKLMKDFFKRKRNINALDNKKY